MWTAVCRLSESRSASPSRSRSPYWRAQRVAIALRAHAGGSLQDSCIDYSSASSSIAGLAVPSFWLGLLSSWPPYLFRLLPPITFTPFFQIPGPISRSHLARRDRYRYPRDDV